MGPRAFVKRRYSTGGRKQVAYDLMKLGAVAALGYGVNDWRNRGKELELTKKRLEECTEGGIRGTDFIGPLTEYDRRAWGKAGSKFVKGEFGPEYTGKTERVREFGRRRRRSTRRKSRKTKKSHKGSKKRKTTRRRKSRKH